jgi:hypothetical protein
MITIRMLVIFTCCCFSLLFPSLKAFGEGDGIPSVGYLDNFSSVIVVGTASLESSRDEAATINISVDRVIKGEDIPQTIRIVRLTKARKCIIPSDSQPVHAIWFLRRVPDGSITFAITPKSQVCQPFDNDYEVPMGQLPAQWKYHSSDSSRTKLAYEIAASIDTNDETVPKVLVEVPFILNSGDTSLDSDVYKKLSKSSNKTARIVGQLGLLGDGDPKQLKDVVSDRSELNFDTSLPSQIRKNGKKVNHSYGSVTSPTYVHVITYILGNIVNGDNSTVAILGSLLDAPTSSQELRLAVAKSLAKIHTPLALTLLAPLLESKDPELRADAIGGIACFANNMPIVDYRKNQAGMDLNLTGPYKSEATTDHFGWGVWTISKSEEYYLSFWKEWWSTNGSAVTASARAGQ